MITVAPLVAAISLGVSLTFLLGRPRIAVLRELRRPASGNRLSAVSAWVQQLIGQVSAMQWRFGLLAAAVCWLLAGQNLTALLMAGFVLPAAIWILKWLEAEPERRRRQLLIAQLPGCLDLLAAALDAGAPLRAAVRHVAALAPEPSTDLLNGVLGQLEIGRSDAQAWSSLRDHPVWGPMARDLARCADSGAAVAEVLGVHAGEARALRRANREAKARATGVRSVLPLVCCFLPAFVLVGVVPIIAATIGSFLSTG